MRDSNWKDIPGYDGVYQANPLGQIRSFKKNPKGKLLKQVEKHTGGIVYYAVSLFKDGVQTQTAVHRIIALTFLERQPGENVVDHINTITTDNRVENLRWTTQRGNLENPITKERRIAAVRRAVVGKYNGKNSPVHRSCIQLDMQGNIIKQWDCLSDAWRSIGIDSSCLTRACQGIQKTAGGYKWRYL